MKSMILGYIVYALINALIKAQGIILGGIPTVLLLAGCMGLAELLCRALTKEKEEKKK